jgi:hypothetical protein
MDAIGIAFVLLIALSIIKRKTIYQHILYVRSGGRVGQRHLGFILPLIASFLILIVSPILLFFLLSLPSSKYP